jgi:hypothetical protein
MDDLQDIDVIILVSFGMVLALGSFQHHVYTRQGFLSSRHLLDNTVVLGVIILVEKILSRTRSCPGRANPTAQRLLLLVVVLVVVRMQRFVMIRRRCFHILISSSSFRMGSTRWYRFY